MYLMKKKRFPILMLIRWSIFLKRIINILCNFIPHETILFDDRYPPWMNKKIKKLIHEKKKIFNCFRRSTYDKQLLDRLKDLQIKLIFSMKNLKENISHE